jgi:hypothetical protein
LLGAGDDGDDGVERVMEEVREGVRMGEDDVDILGWFGLVWFGVWWFFFRWVAALLLLVVVVVVYVGVGEVVGWDG